MPTKNAPTICSIDLGSEHIRVLVAEAHIDGPKLISSGHKPSLKISNGNIHDILLVGEQLLSAVKKAEEGVDGRLDMIYVTSSGNSFYTELTDSNILVSNSDGEITVDDIKEVEELMLRKDIPANRLVVTLDVCRYLLDGGKAVQNPEGQIALSLGAEGIMICADQNYLSMISKIIHDQLGYKIERLFPQATVTPFGMTNCEDPSRSSLVIDYGRGTIDYTVIKGEIQYVRTLPIGLDRVCADIAECFDVKSSESGRLLRAYNDIHDSDDMDSGFISLKALPGIEGRKISVKSLGQVIEARVLESLELIWSDIEAHGLTNSLNNVVICGGASHLKFMKEMVEKVTGLGLSDVSFIPEMVLPEIRDDRAAWVACVGALIKGNRDYYVRRSQGKEKISSQFKDELSRIFGMVKELKSHIQW